MNNLLTYQIAYHILSKFGCTQNPNFDLSNSFSLRNKKFLTKESLKFELEDEDIESKIFSAAFSYQKEKIFAICSSFENELYLTLIIENGPMYGILLFVDEEKAYICSKLKSWFIAPTMIQANLLAALEQVSSLPIDWQPVEINEKQIENLKDFISYCEDLT